MEILRQARENILAEQERIKQERQIAESIFRDIFSLVPAGENSLIHYFVYPEEPTVNVMVGLDRVIGDKSTDTSQNTGAFIFVDNGDTLHIEHEGRRYISVGAFRGEQRSCDIEELKQYRELVDMILKDREDVI